ncbi:GIY-YIG nuclease family protein [Streptomyces mirabilis]|uniref:GIY-YIG nuclease family protein n=1 Tax=Streptomyces mirabilis TaxID=68239 RepID=UPI00225A1BAB|nr:GIY-YIG nuclease family protein [Streptomyces mirabilis]MCX4606965.1 GIY-YIG nuclease family protein [Streptomyces mirabilis]MCX4615727.1 GIY-YIG nuclease family protein [Streptomyces mirabilis]
MSDLDRREPETAVYRIYDGVDRLLYVGITHDVVMRFREHKVDKGWWRARAHRYEVQWFASREIAAAEEREAIKAEHPEFNSVHAALPRREITPSVAGTYSTLEIARRFRISPDTLRPLVKLPDFPRRLVGLRGNRYPADEVERYFERVRPAR